MSIRIHGLLNKMRSKVMHFCEVIIEPEPRAMSNKASGPHHPSVLFYRSRVMTNRGNRFIYFGKGLNL